MKKTGMLFKNTLRRSRMIMLAALLCGLLLCFVYTAMASLIGDTYEGIPIGLKPGEETAVTQDFRGYLTDELGMVVLESTDEDLLNTELVERHIAAIVEMPAGFEQALLAGRATPLWVSFLDDYANAAFVQGYLDSYTSTLVTLAAGADGDAARLASMMDDMRGEMAPVRISTANSTTQMAAVQKDAFRQIIGFFMMFGFFLAFGTSLQLFDDRRTGVYNRVRGSNVRTLQYLLGTCSVGMVSALCLITPFFVFIAITGPSIGIRIWQAAALCFLYTLFVVAAALVFSLYLSSKNAITAGIIGTATITCILGGSYFPLETAPEFMQGLARATPQFWVMNAVSNLQENTSAAWWQNALVVCLFALLFFILAGIRFVHGSKKQIQA